MRRTKKKVFEVTLPPTPCTAQMREQIVTIADERNVSVAEVMRDAISLFLSSEVSKANIQILITNQETEPA